MAGSGLFTNMRARIAHLVQPGSGGLGGEVGDLRQDVTNTFAAMAAICVEEYINPLAAASNNMMAASATPAAGVVQTLLPVAGGGTNELTLATVQNLAAAPRHLVFTVAGATPANAPATATVSGKDARGFLISEVLPLQQVAGSTTTSHSWSTVSSIVYSVGKGTGATVAIGLGSVIGLSRKMAKRAGHYAVIQEVSAGSVVTNGTFKQRADNAAATVTGTVNLVTGSPVMPTTQTIVFAIEGVQKSVTFANPANLAAIVTAVNAVCVANFASAGGAGSDFLTLTDNGSQVGGASTIEVVSGTGTGAANILTVLGFTAGLLYQGADYGLHGAYTPNSAPNGSTSYAVYYEYDGSEV